MASVLREVNAYAAELEHLGQRSMPELELHCTIDPVEQEVAAHPAVSLAAVVAMPDPIFGERVCAYVELRPGTTLTLAELTEEMRSRDVSKENLPERLEILDSLPRGSGDKIAKQKLREDIRRRLEAAKDRG